MGENKHIEEIHAFTKKYVQEIPIESPSLDFTSNLMQKIGELQSFKSAITYKPLISKKAWFIVFAAIIAAVLIPFKSSEESLFNLPELNFSFLEKLNFSGLLDNINVSNTTLYFAITFSVLVSIQIFYLKGYFEKQING
ncbi:MAG: hypothetical protein JKY44_11215 [Flavobacteriaceae bacterium]|nr:hypothetical protein [Flavobacteriaceae bacterium]